MDIASRIRREGPLPFDLFMEAALYGEGGFFTSGHGAGRAGRDFITSPEVGSLFGACVARALDRYWRALGEPDPFLVIEAGAGNGRLARDVLRAQPECLDALRYVLVERSATLRAAHRTRLPIEPPDEALGAFMRRAGEDHPVPAARTGPVFTSLEELPAIDAADAVVFANELLDNLPFGIARWDGTQWLEVRVGLDRERFHEVLVPMSDPPGFDVPAGTAVPIPTGLRAWFARCEATLRRGFAVFVDYMTEAPELRLRTYHAQSRGDDPFDEPGTRDITADVVVEQLVSAASGFRVVEHTDQASWLRTLGIDELAAAGAARWRQGAHRGDLEAIAGRSMVHEADALSDPAGLGAHHVVVLSRGVAG